MVMNESWVFSNDFFLVSILFPLPSLANPYTYGFFFNIQVAVREFNLVRRGNREIKV